MKWAVEPGHRIVSGRARGDVLPVAVVLLFVALAFGQLIGRRALAGYDVTNYSLPNRVQVVRALRSGHIPLWDPFRFGGAPLLASPPAAVLYPLSWPLLPLDPDRAEEVARVLHVAIAALGTYVFARRALESTAVAGVVAAIAFGLGGFVHAHIGHIEQTTALAWLPWALLATDRALAAPRFREAFRPLIGLGFALALSGLAGHPQYLHMGVALVAAYAAMTARPWRRSPRVLVGVALGLALAAAQLLPAWSLSLHSMRAGGLSFPEAAALSLPWREAVTAFLPDYFGPVRLGPIEFWAWVPWSVLFLAGVALAQKPPGRRVWTLAILAVLGWLLALGSGTPLFRIAYELLPGTNLFRVPARWLLIPSLALPLLAAAGVESILRAEPSSRRKAIVLLAAAVLAVAGALFGAGGPRPASIAAGVLALLLTWGLLLGARRGSISGRLAAASIVVVATSHLDIPALLPPGSRFLRHVGDVDLWATPSRGPVFLAGGEVPEGLRLLRDPDEPEKLEVLLPPAAAGQTVVVSEAYSPGWSASGGIPLKRHHDLLISFDAPPGTRQFTLRYRAPGLVPGAALSAAALLISLVLVLIAPRRRDPIEG